MGTKCNFFMCIIGFILSVIMLVNTDIHFGMKQVTGTIKQKEVMHDGRTEEPTLLIRYESMLRLETVSRLNYLSYEVNDKYKFWIIDNSVPLYRHFYMIRIYFAIVMIICFAGILILGEQV